jgi:site-specific recombinase XerD
MNLTNSIIDYGRHIERRNFSPNTIINYLSSIKQFVLWIDMPVETAAYRNISAYIDHMLSEGMSPQTINSNLFRIRGFYDYLHYDKGLEIENPVRRGIGLRLPKPLPLYLRDVDVDKFFSVIKKPRDRAMFKIMLRCGLRVQETADLTMDAIDTKTRHLVVYRGKGGKGRVVYLSNDAKEALSRYLKRRSGSRAKKIFLVEKGTFKGRPLSVRGIRKRMEYYAKKSGVKISCHRLRHTMATQMVNVDANLVTIQSLLGHSNITTTERYSKIHNSKRKRDYFRAMEEITKKRTEEPADSTEPKWFFTNHRRLEVSKNFEALKNDVDKSRIL